MINFVVPGEAVPQARPRVVRYNTYDPPKCREYKKTVSLAATLAMGGAPPLDGAIKCEIIVCRQIPKSYTQGKRLAAKHNMIKPTMRPDIDNLAKGIMDALKGIVWCDDSQVTTLTVKKVWGFDPFVRVTVDDDNGENRQYKHSDDSGETENNMD